MHADSRQTDICAYLSAILVAGLGANVVFGWWWADPIAALAMVPMIGHLLRLAASIRMALVKASLLLSALCSRGSPILFELKQVVVWPRSSDTLKVPAATLSAALHKLRQLRDSEGYLGSRRAATVVDQN